METKNMKKSLSGILVGDELGLLKRIDVHSTSSSCIVTVNREYIGGEPSPSKSIVSINPFMTTDDEESDEEIDYDPWKATHYIIASKPNKLYAYNKLTHQFINIKSPSTKEGLNIVGAQAINRHNIVVCYDNGSVFVQNLDKELIVSSSETKKKAIRLLGLDLPASGYESSSSSSGTQVGSSKAKNHKSDISTSNKKNKKTSDSSQSSNLLMSPNLNTSNTSLSCFKVCNDRIAMAGKNFDLKVFDIVTKQSIFTAKSSQRDWLGLRTPIWVSDLDWIGPLNKNNYTNNAISSTCLTAPSMIATCSRSDSIIRVYDIKCKQRKPIMMMNLKDSTFNNDSNPPSFTSICSTLSPRNTSIPTQQLILGTTMGRLMAIDLRFNSHSFRHIGVFKGFGGGAIRDVKYLPLSGGNSKIISCSLDRFVRVHTFNQGAKKSRHLDAKFYIKTKPTCIQPICSNFVLADISADVGHIDDSEVEMDSDSDS